MGQMRVQTKKGDRGKSSEQAVKTKVKKAGSSRGRVLIKSTFNNTSIFVYHPKNNNLLVWSSCGRSGFEGTKKGTPYAAGVTANDVAQQAQEIGIKKIDIEVKGIGQGRDQAIRALANSGLKIMSLKDTTPIPHNGARAKKPKKS